MQRPSGATGTLLAGGALLVAGTLVGTGLGLAVGAFGDRSSTPPDPPAASGARGPFVGPLAGPDEPAPTGPRIGPPTDSLDASDRLRLDGLGPVRVGMTVAQASAAAAQPLTPLGGSDCPRLAPASGRPDASFLLSAGRVVRVDVSGNSRVRTLSGVGIGTPADEVRRRYGARIVGEADGQRLRFVGDDERFSVVFELGDGQVRAVRGGYAEVVRDGSCPTG